MLTLKSKYAVLVSWVVDNFLYHCDSSSHDFPFQKNCCAHSRSKVSDKRDRSHNVPRAKVSMLLKKQEQFRRQGKNTNSMRNESMHWAHYTLVRFTHNLHIRKIVERSGKQEGCVCK